MSDLRKRRHVIGPGAPKRAAASDQGKANVDVKYGEVTPVRPIGTAAAGHRQSELKRYTGLFIAIAIGWLGYRALPSLSLPNVLPDHYGICTFDESVYISADKPPVQCIVVRSGFVVFHGTRDETRSRYGDRDTLGSIARAARQNLADASMSGVKAMKLYMLKRGHTVLPGLTDAHGHILEYGHSKTSVNLQGASSIQDVIDRVVKHISALTDQHDDYNRVIEGLGFDQTRWPGGAFPTAADLDVPQLKNRKIFLVRVDIHACWISSALLASLDIPDVIPGGVILRYPGGQPTGVFLDTAFEWVKSQLPAWTDAERLDKLHAAAEDLLAQGVTGVHDAATSLPDLRFYSKLDEHRALPFRIYAMVACPKLDEYCGGQIERYDGSRLDVRSVKLFLDGALGSWGAAMLEPYSDNPAEKGISRMSAETLSNLVRQWVDKGFQVNTHAIGDAANRLVVDAYETILRQKSVSNEILRLRIEHAQILESEDIERAGTLGLIASVQPTHCTSDMGYAESRLGPSRVKGAYAWRSLRDAGCPIALGSDFPVEPLNPFQGIYAAVTRLNSNGSSPHGAGGWYPTEALPRQQALAGFTSGAAWARFAENSLGKLEIGFKADIVVADRDIMRADMRSVRDTKVTATIVDGQLVYGNV